MKELIFTRRFERDFRRLKRRVPRHVLDYQTQGAWPWTRVRGFSECHIDADWLLIYRVTADRTVFHRTGTHRDLFRSRRRRPAAVMCGSRRMNK
ncbi:MAG: type II toxin-antitoxin system RelE/ParE family toxin [Betaproteobacteria bacterium]